MTSILIVDDHPAICFALKILLENKGKLSVSISNGENILSQIHQCQPYLLILDLELNYSHGLDLLPRLKAHFPALKILIFTSQPASVYALRTLQAGASGFINKDLPLEHVEPLCHLVMGGYQCFPDSILQHASILQDGQRVADAVLAQLSDREITVLNFLKDGKSNMEIANLLSLSNKTISTYKMRILEKCGCSDLKEVINMLNVEKRNEKI